MVSKQDDMGPDMREKQKIDYIYFIKKSSGGKKLRVQIKQELGIEVFQAEVMPISKERMIRKIKKKIKKYQFHHVVIDADNEMSEWLELDELLFQARKQELMQNRELIFRYFQNDRVSTMRCSMLLVLESEKWSHKDILSLLVTAKDYYEDISIVFEEDYIGVEQIVETLYEEWGVVLHVLSKKEIPEQRQDFILFLSKELNRNIIRKYQFCNAYVVVEKEKNKVRRGRAEKLVTEAMQRNRAKLLYSGFVYEREGKRLPYQRAVNIAYQNPLFYQEINISIVAIYRIE